MVKKSNFSVFYKILFFKRISSKILQNIEKTEKFDFLTISSFTHRITSVYPILTLIPYIFCIFSELFQSMKNFWILCLFITYFPIFQNIYNWSSAPKIYILKFKKCFFKITKCYIHQQALVVEHFNVQKWKIETLGLRLMCQT